MDARGFRGLGCRAGVDDLGVRAVTFRTDRGVVPLAAGGHRGGDGHSTRLAGREGSPCVSLVSRSCPSRKVSKRLQRLADTAHRAVVRCHTVHAMMTPPLSDTILVVEDDAEQRELLVEYLEVKGFTVHESPNGATALGLAETLRPRLILMDLVLPELDGLEATRLLRANEHTREATIIAMTARALATDREAAHRAGCNFFILKPYDLPTLANFVDGLMRQSEPRPQTAGRLPLNFAPQSR
jgi:two-component system cell cycle response regulator DivK